MELRDDHDPDDPLAQRAGEDDLELVRRVIAGDRKAFADLGARLATVPQLMAAANRRMARPMSSDDLDDASQDVIVTIWQKLGTFEGRSTLEGWAYRFCVFELRNRTRALARQRYRQGTSLDSVPVEPAVPTSEPMPFDPDELEAALERLPAEMAEIVRLKHGEGLMFKEIGERLRIPTNTAKTRYYRGLSQMREHLTHDAERAETDA